MESDSTLNCTSPHHSRSLLSSDAAALVCPCLKEGLQYACTVRVAEQEIGQREPKESIREKPPLQREERDPFMRPQAPSEIPQFQTHFCIHGYDNQHWES